MTSSNENIFRVIGNLCGEITGHRWIPPIEASCFIDMYPIVPDRALWQNSLVTIDLSLQWRHNDLTG